MSQEYTYTVSSEFPDGVVDLVDWHEKIEANANITKKLNSCHVAEDGLTVVATFDEALPGADETELDTEVSSYDILPAHKAKKIKEFDKRTDELIDGGFAYNSKTFSATLPSQSKMHGVEMKKDDPALTYPVKWNTKKDDDVESLADAAAVDAFYLQAIGTVRAHLDSGTTLKDSVRAAATIAAVDAVEDTR